MIIYRENSCLFGKPRKHFIFYVLEMIELIHKLVKSQGIRSTHKPRLLFYLAITKINVLYSKHKET